MSERGKIQRGHLWKSPDGMTATVIAFGTARPGGAHPVGVGYGEPFVELELEDGIASGTTVYVAVKTLLEAWSRVTT